MSKSVRPFADQGCYTSVHNALFDSVMPNLKPTAWLILCAIIRATDGWSKAREAISHRKLMELTGIANRRTLARGIEELKNFNPPLIKVKTRDKWEATVYELSRTAEIQWASGGKIVPETAALPGGKSEPAPGGKSEPAPGGKSEPAPGGKSEPHSKSLIETNRNNMKNLSLRNAGEGEKKKAVKVSPEEKPPSNHRHPMAELYREISGCNALNRIQCDLIADQVTDAPRWRAVLTSRAARGWNPRNVQAALVDYQRMVDGETIEQIHGGNDGRNQKSLAGNGNGAGTQRGKRYETASARRARETIELLDELDRLADGQH